MNLRKQNNEFEAWV